MLKKAHAKGIELRGKTLGTGSAASAPGGTPRVRHARHRRRPRRHVPQRRGQGSIGRRQVQADVEIPLVPMNEMFAQADAVTFHVPAKGGPVLDAAGVASMKEGAMLVNTASGGTVDEAAAGAAVTSGHLRAAALDALVGEPKPDPALLKWTAWRHAIGAATEAQDRIGDELVERILELR